MGVNEKLLAVQTELKAPKNQYNNFGKYSYRSCEDILEGVKPVLSKHKAGLFISDSLELIGERYYVKAIVTFVDIESGEKITNTSYAREEATAKGMTDSQITGATSSYARKYALNGLFLIDDTNDADTDEYQNQKSKATKESPKTQKTEDDPVNENMPKYPKRDELLSVAKQHYPSGSDALGSLLKMWNIDSLDKATDAQLMIIFNKYNKAE